MKKLFLLLACLATLTSPLFAAKKKYGDVKREKKRMEELAKFRAAKKEKEKKQQAKKNNKKTQTVVDQAQKETFLSTYWNYLKDTANQYLKEYKIPLKIDPSWDPAELARRVQAHIKNIPNYADLFIDQSLANNPNNPANRTGGYEFLTLEEEAEWAKAALTYGLIGMSLKSLQKPHTKNNSSDGIDHTKDFEGMAQELAEYKVKSAQQKAALEKKFQNN